MPKLFLIAGHTQGKDKGAQNLKTKETENQIAKGVLLQVFTKIQRYTFTDLCPFDFTLQKKIDWINKKAGKDDVSISCHLDSSSSRRETGALCYYYGGSEGSKEKAQTLLDAYCEATGLKNKGVRPDTSSRFKRLGIIRDTKGWSFLLELGSINNDLEVVKRRGADALLTALYKLLHITPDSMQDNNKNIFQSPEWSKEGINWARANDVITKITGDPVSDYRLAAILHKFSKTLRR